MMNQGGNTQTVASLDPNLVENRYVVDASQSQTSYLPTTTGSGAVSWNTHVVDNHSIENGSLPNSTYHHEQQTEPLVRNVQEGVNATSVASSSNSGTIAVSQDYSGYTPYLNSSDPYSYGNTGYPGYYSSYQQQPNHSYSQPVGAYQNTGAPYQPISSFPNSGSYPGSASYSGTYYHPGDYQKAGSYPSSSYNNQLNSWNEGNYANYNPHQYTNYPADASDTYNSGTAAAPAPSLQYQQQYNQWTDYYGSTEVSCAPGTENMPVATASNQVTAPGGTVGYQTTNSQPPTTYPLPWQQDSSSLQMPVLQPTAPINGSHDSYWKHGAPSFQNHHLSHLQSQLQKPMESKTLYDNFQEQQKVACPQGPNSPYPTAQQAPQNFQSPPVQTSLLDNRRASNLQIPTNPRIASNLAIGLQKTNKDSSATTAAKPAYVCISMPKPNEKVLSNDAADSILKPGMFPKSLRGYVERALGRCKDDTEMATCQAVMKEIITKATADGTLYTRDWDTEPLFPLPNGEMVNKDLQNSTPVSALSKYKRSPSRRTKSRWEPLPEEKSINKSASASNDAVKFSGWTHSNEKDKKPFCGNMSKENGLSNIKILLSEQKSANKSTQRPVKRQRVAADGFNALDNGDASSDSDKEQSLTSYYSGAIALVNSPEERMRRENRSKRFEKGQGNRAETNHFKPRIAGAGNLYDRRASALVISKNYEDSGSRAVEDIDWDALTVKGTCQEIEKRYLRLTSAPDPSTVRPEEVLEKALLMVQNSQKNYLYKCDQLKSIRQDLTVQRIRNHLTVRVYETHARLAIEYGDLPEYNQCQSQLKILYAEGIEGCQLEFSAYNLLCVILHSNNKRELLLGMSRLSNVAKEDEAVKHALAVLLLVSIFVSLFFISSSAFLLNDRRLGRSSFPSVNAEKMIRELNLFPKEDVNIIEGRRESTPLLAGPGKKIVEKRFKFPNLAGGVSVDDLGHHAGYYKISHSHDAKMFYFFFESRNSKKDPVVIWLTGGPGCSSELALFYENGPFSIANNLSLVWNEYGWDQASNLLYVDQPTGTGFSYSSDKRDIRHNEDGVSNDLYDFLQAFFEEHPQLAKNDFYITGESYAGHYIPAFASRVHRGNNAKEGIHINLKGFAIGNGLTDPGIQYKAYPDYALEMGIIKKSDYDRITKVIPVCETAIKLCGTDGTLSCMASYFVCNAIFSSIMALAGDANYYDIRKKCEGSLCYDFSNVEKFLNLKTVRDAIGVGDLDFVSCSPTVYQAMLVDWMRNLEVGIPELLEDGVKLLVYAGEYDLICNWLGNSRWVHAMEWSGKKHFEESPEVSFTVDDSEAGVLRTYGPLSFLKVHDAGHMVPMDQPKASLEMLKRWMQGTMVEAPGHSEQLVAEM